MSRVSLGALADYRPDRVRPAIEALLAPLGGIGRFVRPGQQVLLKPNLLSGKDPARAVTTHPEIVRAVIQLVQQAGGEVAVGDSPGIGAPEQVARRSGIWQVIEETGARFAPFRESVAVRIGRGTFHQLELARDVLDADVIINLPKLKTHQMMGLTCAVKNLFGAVVGMRKVRLHLQAGADKAFFALMLLELADHIAPALTVVDAVLGMEGNGPGSGDPVQIGALLAGTGPLAVDSAACALVGMNPQNVWTHLIARQNGRPESFLGNIELVGAPLDGLKIKNFRPAKSTDVTFGLPAPLKNRLKHSLTARPEPDHRRCLRCGLCVSHCPPQVMELAGDRLHIDHDGCIRCFCCQELCPYGAIETAQGFLLKLHSFFGR